MTLLFQILREISNLSAKFKLNQAKMLKIKDLQIGLNDFDTVF
jgi:hypothetical protein